MLNFKCTNCLTEIQAEYQYIGEMVQCPICSSLQVVPDPMLPNGSEFHGYMIGKLLASSMLWNTYEAVGRTAQPDRHVVIRIPTTFFLNSVSDFDAFVDTVIKAGSLNKTTISSLLDRSVVPGKVYFVYEFVQSAYKLSYFSGDRLLDYESALLVCRAIAETLKEVWEKDYLIHQNLIPSNIRITNKFDVRISNIGISEFLLRDQQLLQHGFNIWDYKYMSPEFITQGIANTPSCDIYSLGGILFLLCTGHDPHENDPPDEIPVAPIPSLMDYMEDVPEKLNSLIQLMMAPNPQLRFKTWEEVLDRIDKITTNTAKLRSQNVLKNFNFQGAQSGRYEPVGLHAGAFEKVMKKSTTGKYPIKPKEMSDTVARLASKEEMKSLNKEWKQIRKSSSTGGIKKPKQNKNYTAFIAFAVIAVIGGTALFVAFMSWQAEQDRKARYAESQKTEISSGESVQKPSIPIHPEAQVVDKKTEIKPVKKKQLADLEKELLAIDEFYVKNPDKTDEASKRYDALLEEAVKKRSFDMVDKIQGRINKLSNIDASKQSQKIQTVIAVIKKQILPLLKEEKYEEALAVLREYDGEYAKESRRERLDLELQIRDKIVKIEEQKKEVSDAIQKAVDKFAPSLIEGRILDAKIKMELGLKLQTNENVKQLVTQWLTEVNNYEKLQSVIKNRTAEEIISAPENKSIMENAMLLQGLIYNEKQLYKKAENVFSKLPFQTSSIFIALLKEKDAVYSFKQMLKKYDFTFNVEKPSSLLLQLTQKTLNKDKAETLKANLLNFTEEYKDSAFIKKNLNTIDSLNTYCSRITGESKKDEPLDKALQPGKDNSGKPLALALENAKTGAKIVLTEDEFKIRDLNIKQADLSISGKKGTSINAEYINITGHDIQFNNIIFTGGTVKIEKAHNIIFNNCIFNGRETQIFQSISVTFNNCLIEGIYLEKCDKMLFKHCTILTPKGGIEAAIRIKSQNIEIADSIIHGEKYALMLLAEEEGRKHQIPQDGSGDNPRSRYIHNTLWFGEKALAVKQIGKMPIDEKDIALKSSKLRKFARTKGNIHKPPQFVNQVKGDYNLVKGVPGSKEASDKKDCGVIW